MVTPIVLPLTKEKVLAVGLMSGTSVDGIDAALVEIKGSGYATEVQLLGFQTLQYEEELKQRILRVCHPETSSVDEVCRLNVLLAEKMAESVSLVLEGTPYHLKDLDFVSSHGQTIHHLPNEGATLQIGELAVIAELTKTVTVGDFRPSDMAVGGQGAPLVPFVDDILFRSETCGRALLNIGGMANLTVLPAYSPGEKPSHEVLAFDTGPGNVLIDEMVRIGSNGAKDFDEAGELAQKGQVDEEWLQKLIREDAFLKLPYPKSTGREFYHRNLAEKIWLEGQERKLEFEDIVATVTSFTVYSITSTIQQQLDPLYDIKEVFVGGGGVHNRFIMDHLQKGLKRPVKSMEFLEFSSDAKEAIAFAILGNEFLRQQTNNTPSATGATKAVSMGKLVLPF
ncbi:anhydro-N-acetylmuramic acid kinase [Alkalihalobacillus sp. 1P02AB]|uniref:anhydro-N-acetylmuramic acid kinase n=1 Tax=Alkalihalobacillus sp. 1P02AB TaxID=3132260 RepID=UPI0039A4AB6B